VAKSGELSTPQKRVIAYLLTERTSRDAAKAANVAERTLARWLTIPAFLDALHGAESAALQAVSRNLVRMAEKAAGVLDRAMDGSDPLAAGARVRAADIVMSRLLNLRELIDLESRIMALEEKLHEQSG
jgi:hypothetical protein